MDWHVKDKLGRESLAFPEFPADDREGGACHAAAGVDQIAVKMSMSQQAEPGNRSLKSAAAFGASSGGTGRDLLAVAALLLMSVAIGEGRLSGVALSRDVEAALTAARAVGATIEWTGHGGVVSGLGTGVLLEPIQPIDVSGAPLTAALIMGLVSAHDVPVTLVGEGLAHLPEPFLPLGLQIMRGDAGQVSVLGSRTPPPRRWQVGAGDHATAVAILLSALNTPGLTVIEQQGEADPFILRLFQLFGARIKSEGAGQGRETLSITGRPPLVAASIDVATFFAG